MSGSKKGMQQGLMVGGCAGVVPPVASGKSPEGGPPVTPTAGMSRGRCAARQACCGSTRAPAMAPLAGRELPAAGCQGAAHRHWQRREGRSQTARRLGAERPPRPCQRRAWDLYGGVPTRGTPPPLPGQRPRRVEPPRARAPRGRGGWDSSGPPPAAPLRPPVQGRGRRAAPQRWCKSTYLPS